MQAFLEFLAEWEANLPEKRWADLLAEAGGAERLAIVVVDMVRGFCLEGPLASPRVDALRGPIDRLLAEAEERGVGRVLVICDEHRADAREFAAFPPHCVAGTREAEPVPELAGRLAAGRRGQTRYERIGKNSLSAFLATDRWRELGEAIGAFCVVGNCTDLCVYHLAAPLRFYANQHQLDWRIVVPAELVQTYDLPVDQARAAGALPHDGDLLHRLFLYHLALNGVEVVRRIA